MHHRQRLLLSLAATIGSVAAPFTAQAAPYLFVLTGSQSATFKLDTDKTPDFFNSSFLGSQIEYRAVRGTFGGVTTRAGSVGFGTGPILAQLNISGSPLGFSQFGGPELFSGAPSMPSFTPGAYALSSIVSGNSTLTISTFAGVPEPASWALMIVGFGLVGYSLRYHHRTARARQVA